MTTVTWNKPDITRPSSRYSRLALLCLGVLLLAWAAPLMVVPGDLPEFLQHSQDQQASESTDGTTEAEDTSDDPVVLVSNKKPGLFLLTFALQAYRIIEDAWSPASPVRPPNNLNTI